MTAKQNQNHPIRSIQKQNELSDKPNCADHAEHEEIEKLFHSIGMEMQKLMMKTMTMMTKTGAWMEARRKRKTLKPMLVLMMVLRLRNSMKVTMLVVCSGQWELSHQILKMLMLTMMMLMMLIKARYAQNESVVCLVDEGFVLAPGVEAGGRIGVGVVEAELEDKDIQLKWWWVNDRMTKSETMQTMDAKKIVEQRLPAIPTNP